MSNQIQTQYFLGHPIIIILDEKQNPWFLANDICEILGYSNPNKSINDHCKPKGVTNRYPLSKKVGGTQYPNFISEGNLYRLILRSEKKEAEAFESWVTEELLPSVRKYGFYGAKALIEDKNRSIELYARWDELKKSEASIKIEINEIKKELRSICHKPFEAHTAFDFQGKTIPTISNP